MSMSYGAADETDEETPVAATTRTQQFPSVGEWVYEWFAPTFVRRDDAEFRWCPEWWRHPEPLSRLTGLWRAWESCLSSPEQVNRWWLEHCDPHLRVITAAGGPFGACSQGKGHLGESGGLKVVPMPEGWLNHK